MNSVSAPWRHSGVIQCECNSVGCEFRFGSMAPPRLVGVNLTPAQYREVLTANVTSSMVANGVVFPYHGVSMKQTPRWDEVVPLRHLIKDLFDRSGGAGVLQASWFAACKEFFKDGRYDVKMDQVERAPTQSGPSSRSSGSTSAGEAPSRPATKRLCDLSSMRFRVRSCTI